MMGWVGVVAAVVWYSTRYDEVDEGWDAFERFDRARGEQWRNHPSNRNWAPRCLN